VSYSYLATLRLIDNGLTLAVGPRRRVVFKNRITSPPGHRYADLRKDEIKRVLSPLKAYWGEDDAARFRDRVRDPERPMMTFLSFKTAAKVLLTDAGMLLDKPTED
jgi:hypothetical protein